MKLSRKEYIVLGFRLVMFILRIGNICLRMRYYNYLIWLKIIFKIFSMSQLFFIFGDDYFVGQ